ncbi:MAG: VWA domain-containing protein [Fuerstiella sp.]
MNFANPSAFWALFLAIPIVAVYLVRNRPSTQSVSTLLFWEQVADEPATTSFFKTLRHPSSLLLQLILLLLFVIALSDPSYRTNQIAVDHQVLVIDNSASMQAVDTNQQSRLTIAIAEAQAVINGMSPSNHVSIIVSCPSPQVICPPTKSRALAKSRLNHLQQTDCVGRLQDAVDFANAIAGGSTKASIVIITDGNDNVAPSGDAVATSALQEPTATSGSTNVSTIQVGQPESNVGLTLFRVRRASTDPTLWHLLYEISNFSDSPVAVNLEVQRDGNLIDVLPFKLKPAESRRAVLTKTSREGGLLTGTLRSADNNGQWSDSLAIDDQATSMLANRPNIDVTLVTKGNWFLQQALNANPLVRLTVIEPTRFINSQASTNGIVVFDGDTPPMWPPENSQVPHKALVVAPQASTRLWTYNGNIDTTFVGDFQKSHPLVEYLQLEDIAINSASDVTLGEELNPIVTALEGQPLLASLNTQNTRVLMLAVKLNRSDLPLRSSFPILLTNALEWLADSSPEMLPQADTTQPTTVTLAPSLTFNKTTQDKTAALKTPASKTTLILNHPDGQLQPVAVTQRNANLGQLTKVGLYSLESSPVTNTSVINTAEINTAEISTSPVSNFADRSTSSPTRLLLPCNLVSSQESRLNQPVPKVSAPATRRVQAAGSHWNIQNTFLILVMLAIMVECWLWHRRVVE